MVSGLMNYFNTKKTKLGRQRCEFSRKKTKELRFADDFVIFAQTKEELTDILIEIHNTLKIVRLENF